VFAALSAFALIEIALSWSGAALLNSRR